MRLNDLTILLTGSTGFIGSHLSRKLELKYQILRHGRKNLQTICKKTYFRLDVTGCSNWKEYLKLVDVVIHLAASVHNKSSNQDLFNEVNVNGTLALAMQAADAGVKRFIFISSITVNGESTAPGFVFKPNDSHNPHTPYALSKSEAEQGLMKISKDTGMEVVIIRAPLVYGLKAPANFGQLIRLVHKNIPLPLGAIHNKRSLVGVDNLVDLITTCIDHPKAANQIFLVSDDHDISTSDLLKTMIVAAGNKPMLVPVSVGVLRFLARFLGKSSVIDRVSSNLQVNINHTKDTLGWKPLVSFEEGIRRCFK